jgi:hypothetical protein
MRYKITSPHTPTHCEVGGINLTIFRDAGCQMEIETKNLAEDIARSWWEAHQDKDTNCTAFKDLVLRINSALHLNFQL